MQVQLTTALSVKTFLWFLLTPRESPKLLPGSPDSFSPRWARLAFFPFATFALTVSLSTLFLGCPISLPHPNLHVLSSSQTFCAGWSCSHLCILLLIVVLRDHLTVIDRLIFIILFLHVLLRLFQEAFILFITCGGRSGGNQCSQTCAQPQT